MSIIIVNFKPEHAEILGKVFTRSIYSTVPNFYNQAQAAVWASKVRTPDNFIEKVHEGRKIFVAIMDHYPVGYCEILNNGEIDHFYVDPDYQGKGIGKCLYAKIEDEARDQQMPLLKVDSSESALAFFKQCGFTTLRRNDFKIGDVDIHNYQMQKSLVARSSSTSQ